MTTMELNPYFFFAKTTLTWIKRLIAHPIFGVFFFSIMLLGFGNASGQSTMGVTNLRCEYLSDPVGIDNKNPAFDWQLTDRMHTRAQRQTAYRIIVSSSTFLLAKNTGDLWDSGIVRGDQSALVIYKGKPLTTDVKYYWKIRAFDKNKRPTQWSATATFSMGLLSAADWQGNWIKCPNAKREEAIWYRQSFNIRRNLKSAFIHIGSVGYHELYVNGHKVDDRVLAPALTRIDRKVLYVSYDISAFLKRGKNAVGIWYGPGWSRFTTFQKNVRQGLLAQLNLKYDNGDKVSLATGTAWKCKVSSYKSTGKMQYKDMGGECIDARNYVRGWSLPEFDDRNWANADTVRINVKLAASMLEPSRIIERLSAKQIVDTIAGAYRADMGKNFTGWTTIKFHHMSPGDTVIIQTADDPTTIEDFAQRSYYVCKGGQTEIFCNRFNYAAGRYITIRGLKNKPLLRDIQGLAISNDINRTGYFLSSNPLLNKIYETDLWTYRSNLIEGYVSDCPHRERVGYGEVATATSWGIGLPNYQAAALYRKNISDWTDVQEDNGHFPHGAPMMWGGGGAMWSSAGLNMCWEYYQTYGDRRILEEFYEPAKKWLDFLDRNCKDGILHPYNPNKMHFLGDWGTPEGQKEFGDTPEALFFNNCVHVMNLNTFVKIAKILGRENDFQKYKTQLETITPLIHQYFYHQDTHSYSNGLQVPTAFALWQNLMPIDERADVLAHFEKQLYENQPYLGMGSSGLIPLLHFLIAEHRYDDVIAKYLLKTTSPSYGYFLSRGETTWPEYWSGDVPSRIHTCYTGIASWFIKAIGGIQPDQNSPGYQRFIIKPSMIHALQFANTSVQSIYGKIGCDWKKIANKLYLNIEIPVNTSATVYIPTATASSVSENGRQINHIPGLTFLRIEGSSVVMRLNAGNYKLLVSGYHEWK